MSAPLTGVRVLDVTHAVAAPSATKLLADLGADVWKVEAPGRGDFIRGYSPAAFAAYNRGKRSVIIDLKSESGRAELLRLAATADVFVESQRPGLLASLGLGRDDLRVVNPRLVHASLTGFGPTGPEADRRGVDGVVQALSGMAALQGKILHNVPLVDLAAGLALHGAVLAALLRRERDGAGDGIDISLLDVALYLQAVPIAEYHLTGTMRDDAEHARRFAPLGDYDTADGRIYVGALSDRDWGEICAMLQHPELATDARFATRPARTANSAAARAALSEYLVRHGRAECVAELERRGVMVAPFLTYAEALSAPQVVHNDAFEPGRLGDGRATQLARGPYRLDSLGPGGPAPVPELGQHTADLLAGVPGGRTATNQEGACDDRPAGQ